MAVCLPSHIFSLYALNPSNIKLFPLNLVVVVIVVEFVMKMNSTTVKDINLMTVIYVFNVIVNKQNKYMYSRML